MCDYLRRRSEKAQFVKLPVSLNLFAILYNQFSLFELVGLITSSLWEVSCYQSL